MKRGETKTITDDGRTITVTREGDSTVVRIEGAGDTHGLTITRDGDRIQIGRHGDTSRSFVIGPGRRNIIIDGMTLDEFAAPGTAMVIPRHRMESWFVCPKDHSMLRVPDAKEGDTFKCPVDGTIMEKRKGKGFMYFFNDSMFESHDM